jgi:hypothetical protein
MQSMEEFVELGAHVPPSHGVEGPSSVHAITFSPHVGGAGVGVGDGVHEAPVATADTLKSRFAFCPIVGHVEVVPACTSEHVLVIGPSAQAPKLPHDGSLEIVTVGVPQVAPVAASQVQLAHGAGVARLSPPFNSMLVPWGHESGIVALVLWKTSYGPLQSVATGIRQTGQTVPLDDEDEDEDDEDDDDDDEDDEDDDDDDELDEPWPPFPPLPSCGAGPGHPVTAAGRPAKSAATSHLPKGRSPCRREPFE